MGSKKGQTNGVKFGSGQDPTKGGRPPLSDKERAVRESTRMQIAEVVEKFQVMNSDQLEEFQARKDVSIFELGVASAYLEFIRTGDFTKIDKIFDRTLGKAKNIIEHQGFKESDIRDDAVRVLSIQFGLVDRTEQDTESEKKEETKDPEGEESSQ